MNNALIRRGYCRIFHWIHTFGGDIRNLTILLLLSLSFGTVTDIDGNVYQTVQIGEQLWMAENLKVTHYNNGDAIPTGYTDYEWANLSTDAYAVYDNNSSNADTYGNLYNWYTVDDSRGVCPDGYHVPSDDEYKQLEIYLGMDPDEADDAGWRGTDEGGKLKEVGLDHWNSPNTGATNESGFTGLPAGMRSSAGNGWWDGMGVYGKFWSSTEYDSNRGFLRMLFNWRSEVGRNYQDKFEGFSIRCLADDITTGCTDPEACNYDETANVDDGSCEYYDPEVMCDCDETFLDINGDCCGYLLMDDCWVCNGDGPEENHDCDGNCMVELDCAGNCCVLGEEGCYWQEAGPCGEPGPNNGTDSCGVCGGDNSSCVDCSGVPCSNAYIDNCGVCDDDPYNDCVQGCDNIWGSGVEIDECGICDGDGSSCADSDDDGCTDDIDDAPYEWDDDYDMDGLPDDCDADDDNDGVEDYNDPDDNNEFECSDNDGDTCDDCSSGTFDTTNDGEDYDADGLCNLGDMDDDNDGVIDNEDCAPLYELAAEIDCCEVCGGDNSSCSNCCGIPFGEDCSSDCVEDGMGVCCLIDDLDECGMCFGDNACLCYDPFIYINGHCLHQDDIAVLQDMIDNSMNSGYIFDYCYDQNDPWCQSPNLYMDQSANWHEVLINGQYYQFSNDNGIVEPLELGLQEWVDGRIISLMCGAYIYCQLSGEIPESISNLMEIEVLRLEVNYFIGEIPESVCDLENVDYSDDLAFNFSYNMLCPPYPDCVPDGAVNYMDISECWQNGDINSDGAINVLDVVSLVDAILNGIDIDGGDINGDNAVNVIDIVMLVNMILSGRF